MNDPLGWTLIGLCIAWGAQAVLAVIAQRKLAERARNPQTQRFAAYRPPAALIVPFKGVEPALQGNLQGLLTQHYPDYRVLMVVEDQSDPAYPVLRDAIAQHPQRKADILFAGVAGPNEGQKVHNLIAAVEKLQQENAGEEVWVFADSDAVPGPDWLAELVGPLCQERTAVTTGFRWLIPHPSEHPTQPRKATPSHHNTAPPPPNAEPERSEGSDIPPTTITGPGDGETSEVTPGETPGGPSFWSKIASILNSSTTGLIRRDAFTHAWGGSMAMRVTTANEADLLSRWRGAISDDYQVTRMCRDLDKRVYFVPECLVASPVDYDFKGLCNFAYRQYVITRIHAPLVFTAAVFINALYFLGLASAITILARHPSRDHVNFAIGVLVLVFIANQARATYRRSVVRSTLGRDTAHQLKSTFTLERWTTPLWLGINLLLLLAATFGKTISWRNIRYRINAPQDIQRL
jgi:Glycosyltransferase like family 2